MKKSIFLSLLMLVCIAFAGCSACQSEQNHVEHAVSADRQWMYNNYGGDYRWYETCVLLKDFMDEDCDGTIENITNVFQNVTFADEDSTCADVEVVLSSYGYGKHTTDVKNGFWVGDNPLNEQVIKITFKEAFDLMMSSNYPKPHSRHCVLRKEVGPVEAAPQYIFGNTQAQLYVDAVSGDVSEDNPAYKGFKMPLGEWP